MAEPVVDAEYLKEIEKARRDLRALISSKNCAPLMLHLGRVAAVTYSARKKTGGPNGSIRNKQELKIAVELCEEVKTKHPKISYADLYQLAGVVAVEVTGGPTIDFVPGRKDSMESPEGGRLLDAKQGASHLEDIFCCRGLTDKDIVALSGANHILVYKDQSCFEGQGRRDHLKFDNSFFVELLKGGSNDTLMLLDKTLDDARICQYVELYAKDEEAFFADYAASHKKLSELGFNPPSKVRARLTRGAIGVAIATITAAIVTYLFDLNRRSKRRGIISGPKFVRNS